MSVNFSCAVPQCRGKAEREDHMRGKWCVLLSLEFSGLFHALVWAKNTLRDRPLRLHGAAFLEAGNLHDRRSQLHNNGSLLFRSFLQALLLQLLPLFLLILLVLGLTFDGFDTFYLYHFSLHRTDNRRTKTAPLGTSPPQRDKPLHPLGTSSSNVPHVFSQRGIFIPWGFTVQTLPKMAASLDLALHSYCSWSSTLEPSALCLAHQDSEIIFALSGLRSWGVRTPPFPAGLCPFACLTLVFRPHIFP